MAITKAVQMNAVTVQKKTGQSLRARDLPNLGDIRTAQLTSALINAVGKTDTFWFFRLGLGCEPTMRNAVQR